MALYRAAIALFLLADRLSPYMQANAAVHNVEVGGTAFSPAQMQIAPGDSVVWKFSATQHSVTQVGNSTSCAPLPRGFDSSLKTAPAVFQQVFKLPGRYWYTSKRPGACQGKMRGIVMVINSGPGGPNGGPGGPGGGTWWWFWWSRWSWRT
ncbi:hypothetical protein BASA60_007139 [Batrachochytrium salamandrivorans]|nr:hypothetical protein BASA60_007139 [Batrachochytrium salamandrivorans]